MVKSLRKDKIGLIATGMSAQEYAATQMFTTLRILMEFDNVRNTSTGKTYKSLSSYFLVLPEEYVFFFFLLLVLQGMGFASVVEIVLEDAHLAVCGYLALFFVAKSAEVQKCHQLNQIKQFGRDRRLRETGKAKWEETKGNKMIAVFV